MCLRLMYRQGLRIGKDIGGIGEGLCEMFRKCALERRYRPEDGQLSTQ